MKLKRLQTWNHELASPPGVLASLCHHVFSSQKNKLKKTVTGIIQQGKNASVTAANGDLISFNNKRFKEFISDICSKERTISETKDFTSVASYLDLLFTRDENNNITTKL